MDNTNSSVTQPVVFNEMRFPFFSSLKWTFQPVSANPSRLGKATVVPERSAKYRPAGCFLGGAWGLGIHIPPRHVTCPEVPENLPCSILRKRRTALRDLNLRSRGASWRGMAAGATGERWARWRQSKLVGEAVGESSRQEDAQDSVKMHEGRAIRARVGKGVRGGKEGAMARGNT